MQRLLEDPCGELGALLVRKKDISFQDMQSATRAFREYLGCEIARGEDMNDVIVAQAFRHAIVHTAGVVDDRLCSQVANAKPRRLKSVLAVGAPIQFSPTEVHRVGASMTRLVEQTCDELLVGLAPPIS